MAASVSAYICSCERILHSKVGQICGYFGICASVLLVEVRSHVYTLSIVPFFSLELSSFLLFCPLSLFLSLW